MEEQLVKQLAEVRDERDELVVAERVVQRISEQGFGEYLSLAPALPEARVGGRSVLLIPDRAGDGDAAALPPGYQRILAIVREAAGPVKVKEVGGRLGLPVELRGKLEPLRGKMNKLADRGWLRKLADGRFAPDLAGGNDVSATTMRRWCDEVVALLAAKAPRLDRTLRKIARRGGEVVLIDGTLIPTRRRTGKDNRPNYSGKHKRHGLHFLALTDENGRLIWISAARPGRTHDITAGRHDHIVDHLKAAGLGAMADLGFLGLADNGEDPVVVTGYKATKKRKLTTGQKTANKVISAARALVEHGFAHLKNWRVLTKLRVSPARATNLLRALLVLTNLEVNR